MDDILDNHNNLLNKKNKKNSYNNTNNEMKQEQSSVSLSVIKNDNLDKERDKDNF